MPSLIAQQVTAPFVVNPNTLISIDSGTAIIEYTSGTLSDVSNGVAVWKATYDRPVFFRDTFFVRITASTAVNYTVNATKDQRIIDQYNPDTGFSGSIVTSTTDVSGDPVSLTQNGAPINLSDVSGGVMFSAPTIKHGASLGYLLSDHWNNKADGKLYQCLRNTDGAAVWKLVPKNTPYIVDAVGATVAACYGVTKLVKAYAGAAFQITLPSTATLDIGFVSDGKGGEVADWAAADKFCAGVVGRITTWYDQSGGAFHATQGTYANAPSYSPYQLQEIPRGIVFDGFAGAKQLALPVGVAVARANHTAYVVGQFQGSFATNVLLELGPGTSAGTDLYINLPYFTGYVNGIKNSNLIAHTGPCASVYEQYANGASGTELSIDDKTTVISGTVGASAMTGGKIGYNTLSSTASNSVMHAIVIYNASLTSAQRTTFKQASYLNFGIAPQLRNSLAVLGDSIDFGGQLGITMNPMPAQLSKFNYQNKRIYNCGISGKTAAAMLTDIAWMQSIASQNVNNYASIDSAGTNDVTASTPPATIASYHQSMISALKSYGYQKIGVGTLTARAVGTFGTAASAVSAILRSGVGQDFTVDYDADPSVGAGQSANTTYFNADGVHLTEIGQAVKNSLAEQKLKLII